MSVNKVIYGTTVLVDLTADTVDAAHLAKGYTAHDASGNVIVGTYDPATEKNLLYGITPSLLNGTTQSGTTYVTPARNDTGNYPLYYVSYQLSLSTLSADTTYHVSASVRGDGASGVLTATLFYVNSWGNETYVAAGLNYGTTWATSSMDVKLTAGNRPTSLQFAKWGKHPAVSISDVVLTVV